MKGLLVWHGIYYSYFLIDKLIVALSLPGLMNQLMNESHLSNQETIQKREVLMLTHDEMQCDSVFEFCAIEL